MSLACAATPAGVAVLPVGGFSRFASVSEYTLMARVRVNSLGSRRFFLGDYNSSGAGASINWEQTAAGQWWLMHANTASQQVGDPGGSVTIGWHWLEVVFRKGAFYKAYVDGALISNITGSVLNSDMAAGVDYRIGRCGAYTLLGFDGDVAFVASWDRALRDDLRAAIRADRWAVCAPEAHSKWWLVPNSSAPTGMTALTSLSAAIQLGLSVTAGLEAAVRSDRSVSTIADAAVLDARAAQATLDSAVRTLGQAVVSLETAVRAGRSATASTDAAVQLARSATAALELAVSAQRSSTASVSTQVQAGALAAAAIDAYVQAGSSVSTAASLGVLAGALAQAGLDGAVMAPRSTTAGVSAALDAARQAAGVIDAALQLVRSATSSMSAQVQAGTGVGVALDLALSAAINASAGVQAAISISAQTSASLSAAAATQRSISAAVASATRTLAMQSTWLSTYVFSGDVLLAAGRRRILMPDALRFSRSIAMPNAGTARRRIEVYPL